MITIGIQVPDDALLITISGALHAMDASIVSIGGKRLSVSTHTALRDELDTKRAVKSAAWMRVQEAKIALEDAEDAYQEAIQ